MEAGMDTRPLSALEGQDAGYANKEIDDMENSGFDNKATRKLLRKIDWMLLPFLSFLYLLSFLDRANIGNARLAGLEEDLNMTGEYDYNIAVAVFFPFYVAAEIPSNLMMKRFRPSVWIPSIMVAWGLVCILMGLVKSFPGLVAARCALGLAEGGLFPGIMYYITLWYRRHECGMRMAIFFSAATAAGAFGGILARAIMELDGVAGRPGWSWIFIVEGIVTAAAAVAAFFLMHDYPETAGFLTQAEKQEVARRLKNDQSALADEFDLKYVYHALRDTNIWLQMVITIGIITPMYSVSIFLPSIVRGMGYTDEKAQLMSAPPYIVACFACIAGGYGADKQRRRGVFMVGFCLVSLAGLAMLMASENSAVRYAGCFLAAAGVFSNAPQGIAWNGNNIGGSVKRGVGIAMQVGFGNLGGAAAGFIYRKADAPLYLSGHAVLSSLVTSSLVLSLAAIWWLRRENQRRDAAYKPPAAYSATELAAEREKGDRATFFRYTI